MTARQEPEVQSARSYALVGLIFYLLSSVSWLLGALGIVFVFPFMIARGDFIARGMAFIIFPIGVFLALSVGFTVLAWITMNNITEGRYGDARTSSLVLGVFGIFLAWVIGGIFFLLAHGKLGEVVRASQAPQQPTGRVCPNCGRPVVWDSRFCQYCGKQLV